MYLIAARDMLIESIMWICVYLLIYVIVLLLMLLDEISFSWFCCLIQNGQGIDEKVKSLNYEDVKAEIKSVDSQHSLHSGVQVFVTGYMTGKDKVQRNFAQTFFLAPQDGGGYYVLNDMFRYVGKPNVPEGENPVLSREIDTPFDAEEGRKLS